MTQKWRSGRWKARGQNQRICEDNKKTSLILFFLCVCIHPEMKHLPICTPPSLPINLMSLLCCDCLEGMRLEGHQGILCVILARGGWGCCGKFCSSGSGAWCSPCCWWLAKKAWPKSVVSSSSSISRRLSCKKGHRHKLLFCYVFSRLLTNPNGLFPIFNERTNFWIWGFRVVVASVDNFVKKSWAELLPQKLWGET